MKTKLGQELAFPVNEMGADREISFNPGMSQRFYVGCAVLQGLLAEGGYKEYSENIIVQHSLNITDEFLKQINE